MNNSLDVNIIETFSTQKQRCALDWRAPVAIDLHRVPDELAHFECQERF